MPHRGHVVPVLVTIETTPARYATWNMETLLRHTLTACRQLTDEGDREGWW